jgi:hypothetical protein
MGARYRRKIATNQAYDRAMTELEPILQTFAKDVADIGRRLFLVVQIQNALVDLGPGEAAIKEFFAKKRAEAEAKASTPSAEAA